MIQGTEHEYTYFCRSMHAKGVDPHTIALDLLRRSDLHSANEFIRNQSRAYYDVGHIELSTCEVSNFMDLVIWEKAGEKIVDWLRKKVEELHCSDSKIRAYKNNTSPDGTSYGSHENYCIDRKVDFPESFVKCVVPHLVTRFIYTGAGDIIDERYVLSPSAYLTSIVVSNDTMHRTGVLNTRDEALASSDRFRRLHLQVGDALMNETAIMLRHFTTSHILRLMELGKLSDVPELSNPMEDMWHNVEQTNPDKWRIRLTNGDVVSPIDIQKYYLEKIELLVEDDEAKRALKTLEKLLDDLADKKSKQCARKVEWLDRYFAIKEELEKAGGDKRIQMVACKRYSEIGEERSIFYRRQKEGLIDRVIEDKPILDAVYNPPKDTRAFLRAQVCETYDVDFMNWDYAIVKDPKENGKRRIDLDDPYSNKIEDVKGG
jgi:proteasome accessory factor A